MSARIAEAMSMSQFAAEIAKALTIAAVTAQPKIFDQDPKSSFDAPALGHEVTTERR